MSIEQRIRVCRVLEKMEGLELYNKKLGIENSSTFHGRRINYEMKSLERKDEVLC